ncbi:MAG TPA: PQQ-binding-like beta-propeller repeat protein [Acidimicrobiales bacterium]
MARNRRRRRLGGALGAGALALGATGCWPAPGQGPNRDAYNPLETTLTAANVATLTEAWSAPLDGPTFVPVHNPSAELVTGHGAVYVNDAGALYRLDAATGARDWRWPIPDAFPPDHAPEMAQPFVVGDRLLAAYGSHGDLASQDAEWHTVWLDPATGGVVAEGPIDAIPVAIRGDRIAGVHASCGDLAFCSAKFVVADLDDGTPLATGDHGPHVYNFEPSTLGEERLYHSGVDVSSVSSRIQAFPLDGGRGAVPPLWTRIIQFQGPATGPVLGADGSVLYTTSGGTTGGGRITALDAATGDVLWTGDLGATVGAPPALAEGRLYVPTRDGDLLVFDAAGCGAATCAPLWAADGGTDLRVQPAVAGGVVYTGSEDGTVAAFPADGCGASTCPPLWSAAAGRPVVAAPIVSNARLHVYAAGGGAGEVVTYALP